jgi:chorismate dehydratase
MVEIPPIRIAAVSYINTYPFMHGLAQRPLSYPIDLSLEIPAECARKVLAGEVDLGLIPVAVIPLLNEAHIISDFCIGADGAVDSVCLFSEVPLEEVTEVLLDFQSRTSVQLMRVLASRHFHITPKWTNAAEGYIGHIKGTTAGVVIGDRAFPLLHRFPVVIDLALEWQHLTGLPFVFACWVSNRVLPADFIAQFNEALGYGVDHREEAVRQRITHDVDAMIRYVNNNISYGFDARKRQALELFTRWSAEL